MIISEKQILQLIQGLKEYIFTIDVREYQTEEYRDKLRNLLTEIIDQQSEELKVIE